MAEYINRGDFLAKMRKIFCEDCSHRKGMKDGKPTMIIYEIGEAPCRACLVEDVLTYLEEFPVAYVDEVVYCKECKYGEMMKNGCTVFCHNIGTVKTAFSYCSSAERKVNVENYCGDS